MKTIIEMAKEAGIYCTDRVRDFAALVRADERERLLAGVEMPEPDAYLFQHDETGNTMFVDAQQVAWGFEKANPRLQKISGAHTADQLRETVAAAVAREREACAKVCDDMAFDWQKYVTTPSGTITACAAAIRARGNT